MSRALLEAVLESMDACDPTRSHELVPSRRLASRTQSRRAARRLLAYSLIALAVIAIAAALLSRPSTPSPAASLPAGADGLLFHRPSTVHNNKTSAQAVAGPLFSQVIA